MTEIGSRKINNRNLNKCSVWYPNIKRGICFSALARLRAVSRRTKYSSPAVGRTGSTTTTDEKESQASEGSMWARIIVFSV